MLYVMTFAGENSPSRVFRVSRTSCFATNEEDTPDALLSSFRKAPHFYFVTKVAAMPSYIRIYEMHVPASHS